MKGKHRSLIIATGHAGILAHDIRVGSTNRLDFASFLKTKWVPSIQNQRERTRMTLDPLYLVTDNASIHKGRVVEAAVNGTNIHIVYQPAYAPTFHATEQVNAQTKGYPRAMNRKHVSAESQTRVALTNITRQNVRNHIHFVGRGRKKPTKARTFKTREKQQE